METYTINIAFVCFSLSNRC